MIILLEQLFKKGYVHYEKLIMDNAKKLGINAEETMVLIALIKEYFNCGNISPNKLQDKLLMSANKIDKTIAGLMERGYYEIYIVYDNGIGNERVSFQPLFKKLEEILNQKDNFDKYDIAKANKYLSEKLNRVLTAQELEILQGLMIEDHYSYDQIITAVDDIIGRKKVLSMRSLTQTLANKKIETKPKKEAPQAFKDFYSKI